MEQQKKRPGRPKASAPTQVKKKPSIKRNISDAPRPTLFKCDRGGIYLKISNSNLSVFDNETGRVRALRYCPGENSVWKDEQSDASVVEQVVFNNKILVVPVEKPNLLKFLELHPQNKANGGKLFYKPESKEAVAEETIEQEFLIHDAIALIKNRPIDELLPVAMAMNIDQNQKDIAIKQALVRQAKADPAKFMSMFDSPMVHTRSTVMQAFDFLILALKNGAVVWFDTGKLIVSVPVGQDKVDVVTRFAMTDNGSSVLAEIERQLEDIA